MENLRRYDLGPPFQYKGHVVQAILYYSGNSDLVHSWDIAIRGFNVSKASPQERREKGFTDDDMEVLNRHVANYVAVKEGRRIL